MWKVVFCFICVLLILGIGIGYRVFFVHQEIGSDKIKQNYETVFTSSLFDCYYQQLFQKAVVLKHLPQDIRTLLTYLQTTEEKREAHEALITALRKHLDTDPIVIQDLDEFSFYLLTQIELLVEQEKILNRYLNLSNEKIDSLSLPKLIRESYALLSEQFSDTEHYSNIPERFDPLFEGFLTSKLFMIDTSHYLYFFSPMIIEKATKQKSVDPIFLSYLRHLKRTKQKHLYINVKSRDFDLENLAKHSDYNGTFLLITLDKSSDFYRQRRGWENQHESEAFKLAFRQNLFDSSAYSHWPDDLLNNDWNKTVAKIIDDVHSIYFDNMVVLDVNDRRVFIEIVYVLMVGELRQRYRPQYINATCQFTMDRGPSQYAIEYLFDQVIGGHELTTQKKRQLLTMFFISPIIGHHRTSRETRVNRLSDTLERLQISRG